MDDFDTYLRHKHDVEEDQRYSGEQDLERALQDNFHNGVITIDEMEYYREDKHAGFLWLYSERGV